MLCFFLCAGVLILVGCATDPVLHRQLEGTWEGTIQIEKSAEGKALTDEVSDALKDAEDAIREELISPADSLIPADKDVRSGLAKMGEGLLALTDGLSELSHGLIRSIVKILKFNVAFKENGALEIDQNYARDVSIQDKSLQWKIDDGRLIVSVDQDTIHFQVQHRDDQITLRRDGLAIHLNRVVK